MKAKVVEKGSGAPIPFASVYTLRNRRGTITDVDGDFELTGLAPTDTLVFYFAGFSKKMLLAKDISSTVELEALEQLLDDVIVLADESGLYRMMSGTRKNVRKRNEIAQTYFEQQSFVDDKQLEYFQGYYNGEYDGYDIDDLTLKTARFGISATDNMAYLSHETSKALYKHRIFRENEYYPDSPFGLSGRKLLKRYSLALNSKYKEQNGDITYVISFTPKKDTLSAFSGKAWIDSASNILTKVEFKIKNAAKFPFQPIHKGGELRDINMHITKSYERTDQGVRLRSMDFNYDFLFEPMTVVHPETKIVHRRPMDTTVVYIPVPGFHIRSEAVLSAYNYNDAFYIPKFNFANPELADYKQIMVYRSHPKFWRCYNTFRVGRSDEKERFLDNPGTITHRRIFQKNEISDVGIYEYQYRKWTQKRIYFRKVDSTMMQETNGNPFEGNSINARKYFLEAQIFMEIDSLCGELSYRTGTFFDPYTSYYNFERTPTSVAFLNVYFDLMEIQRRELEAKLMAAEPSAKEWMKIYDDHLEKVARKMQLFFKEVERGTHEENFAKWNAIVMERLGIDNIALFTPEEEGVEK